MAQKVAVILSGCGHLDGSDAAEVSPICVALSRAGMTPVFYAPYVTMTMGVNHVNGVTCDTDRNVLIESARLVRDPVQNLQDLSAEDEDIIALIMPGGSGVLNNLSNFATSMKSPTVQEDVVRVISEFKSANKPIGCTSYANVLISLVIPEIEITLGGDDEEDYPNTPLLIDNLTARGTTITSTEFGDICVDSENKIASIASFLYVPAKYDEVADSISRLVDEVLDLANQ
ncbi:glutamine amidotransferase-like class 1 domain-containing protein 3, mitochondrial isoform X2 [Lepeophtheirus salmonis]|nr:glutamine amidotransferase-like class 1 domain-containing protein 3A, mitochondrial [Lepeophtheirus salmonis]